jgi:predicted alpha/beta superfamily hydrolase
MIFINLKKSLLLPLLVMVFNVNLFALAITKKNIDTIQIIKIDKFNIPQLGRQRIIRICLPKGYSSSDKRYPVIYMQDAQNLFKSNAEIKSTWAVDSTLKALPVGKQCIIVGIDHAGKDRITEYDPYDSTYGKGNGAEYTRFLVETLKPYIDAHYRTKQQARYTAIAGSSMGSLLAMYAAIKYPETFGYAGIFSPSFWIAPQIYIDTKASVFNKKAGFYLICGDKESLGEVKDVNKMDSLLHAKGFSLKQVPAAKINEGSIHNEAQWREAFPAFYNWLAERFGL